MQTLRVLNATFIRPKDFSVDKFLKGSFGVYSGGKPIEIRIWFDSFAARLVQERMWHHSQKVHQLSNNEIELTLTLTSTVEIIPWILSWGVHGKALAPKELTVEIAKSLHGTIQHYT
jgi:proteasome accessory factor B